MQHLRTLLASAAAVGAIAAAGLGGAAALWNDQADLDAVQIVSGNLDLNLSAERLDGCVDLGTPTEFAASDPLTLGDLAAGVTSTRTFDVILEAGSNDNLHGDLTISWPTLPNVDATGTYDIIDPAGTVVVDDAPVGETRIISDIDGGSGWTIASTFRGAATGTNPVNQQGGAVSLGTVDVSLDQKTVA